MTRKQIMQMPYDSRLQAKSCRRCHQSSADAVSVNYIGFDTANFLTNLLTYAQKRSEVTDKMIRSPGKPGFQSLHGHNRRQLSCQFHEWPIFGTHDHRVKLFAIQPRDDHKQQTLGAACLTGVVVEKNLHFLNIENRNLRSEI